MTETVTITGSSTHLVANSSNFILFWHVFATVSTGKTILMLFVSMPCKVVVRHEYIVTAWTLKFFSRVWKYKWLLHSMLYSDMIIQILFFFVIEMALSVFTFKLNFFHSKFFFYWDFYSVSSLLTIIYQHKKIIPIEVPTFSGFITICLCLVGTWHLKSVLELAM